MPHPEIKGSCLCGAVTVRHLAPEKLVRCNCAACRRYGALWAHGTLAETSVTANGPLIRFTRADGDGDIAFSSCATCGVTTHWEPTTPDSDADRMAINATLCDPATLSDLPLRHFDGADTWAFLD